MPNTRVAYILSRFPVLTETFVIAEIQELRTRGVDVEVFSLKQPVPGETYHKNTEALIKTTHYYPYVFSSAVWKGLFYYLINKPLVCLNILKEIIRTHVKNSLQLLKTLAVIPKTFAIAKALNDSGINRIHAHWATVPATSAWIAAKLNDIPYTFTAHAWDIFESDTMLEEKIRDAEKVVTISDYNKTYLLEKYPALKPDKITVVHCGVDLGKFAALPHDRKELLTILSIGRLTEKKGFDVLLEACRILKDRNVHFQCRIVYVSGDYEEEIFRRYKTLDLRETVHFIPGLPQEGIIEEYSKADCFVLPSVIAGSRDRDGIPVVILEALAMELPVVTTPVSGIPEVIKDSETGLLVEPGSAEQLAESIERICRDKELSRKLGKAGRDFVNREFEISSCVDRLLNTALN
jgi:colanic acid/amylovoran biosynthesis glycosyltransferase